MQRREIQAAVQTDDVELFRFLLQKEGLSPNYDTSRDFSPLFQACIWNSPNIVFELLHSEERWFDPEHPNSIAAFRMACYYGYEQIVDTFVDALESWCPAPEYKEGPYETARMMGRTDILLTMDSHRTIMRSLLDLRESDEGEKRAGADRSQTGCICFQSQERTSVSEDQV